MEVIKSKRQSPSNIAIVKYWGKKGFQLPANPSISFTLDNVYTETEITLKEKRKKEDFDIEFFFESKPKPEFIPKMLNFFNAISADFPWLKDYCLEIHSHNNFPYGTGIASSASAISALTLCIMDLDNQITANSLDEKEFLQKSSFYSRIGSGSACRSVYGGFVEWGQHPDIAGSSDEYAVQLQSIHPNFIQIKDTVLLIESTEKSVSSSKGHAMLNDHWYSSNRYRQGFEQTRKLYEVLQNGDIQSFGEIAEQEALTLHAMMLTSSKGYFLIQPNTLNVLNAIREIRKETQIPVYFTMDAGANVHLLYFEKDLNVVRDFINDNLLEFCSGNKLIHADLKKH